MDENTSNINGKQRLWVLTELYYPEETSTGYYMTRIAEGLSDDLETRVLCGQPNYSKRGTKAAKRETRRNVEIFRVGGTTFDKNVVLFRLMNMITLSVSMFFTAIRRLRKGDKVLVVTTPPLLPFIAATASLIKGASYTLLIHDNYPEILFAVGKSKPGSLFSRSLSFANRWLYKYAAKIIVVGRDMKDLVERKTAGLDIPIAVIPNWAELETVEPRDRSANELIKELGLEDKFIFLYAGNMGHPNDMESIVEAADRTTPNERVHFIFLGTGVKRPWLEREVARRGLKNISVLDPRPRSEQTMFLNACDVGLVSLVGKMKGVSMPSRTYNILAACKPILAIADDGSEVALVTEEDNVGMVVPPADPDKLISAINEFMILPKIEFDEMGRRARSAAVNKYSLADALAAYRREIC